MTGEPGSQSAISNATARPDATLPKADVPGEDFSDLPRYPGSIRTEIEIRRGLVEIEIEVSEPQKVKEARKDSSSPQRSEQAALSTTPSSHGEYEDGFDEDAKSD